MNTVLLIFWGLLGLCVGSFLNVLILRIPKGEEFVKTPSHCMLCGHPLSWYENIPLVSFLVQKGRCRHCGGRLTRQYPIVEAANCAAWLLTAAVFPGNFLRIGLYSALFSCLLTLSVIDWRTYTIPNGLNLAVFLLGLLQLALDRANWALYLIGMVSVSGLFLLLHLLTRGQGMGLGDVKLMAGAGLLLGWPRILLAMIVGSLAGCIIHLIRMRRGVGHKLAFGPYLAGGVWFAAMVGEPLIAAYLGLFF